MPSSNIRASLHCANLSAFFFLSLYFLFMEIHFTRSGCFSSFIDNLAVLPNENAIVAKQEIVAVKSKNNTNTGIQANKVKRSNETFFRVVDFNTDGMPSEVQIEVVRPKHPNKFAYSATVSSYGKYTGSATLISELEGTTRRPQKLMFSWKPSFPGTYEIFVHEIRKAASRNRDETPLIEPSPYQISIKGELDVFEAFKDKLKNMPSCQEMDTAELDLFSKWDGDWLGPDFDVKNKLRTGWSFVPKNSMNCSLETFTQRDLLSIPEKRSIYILGTSIERGIFLSLVDLLLSREEKEKLALSEVGKCWGRAIVKKGNLELLYQDLRPTMFELPGEDTFMECHNDKVASEPGILENATTVWKEIFSTEKSSFPSVVLMKTRHGSAAFDAKYHLQRFVSMLPSSWDGWLLLADAKLSAMEAGLENADMHKSYVEESKELLKNLNDNRVRLLDGIGISEAMRMYAEKGERFVTRSQHFHRFCNETFNDDGRVDIMNVCSNITEILGQLLLGHALNSKRKFSELSETDDNTSETVMSYCHACPKNLLPFHVTPYPNMTCASGPFHERNESGGGEFVLCPTSCLNKPVFRTFRTQSDEVSVRKCPASR